LNEDEIEKKYKPNLKNKIKMKDEEIKIIIINIS